MKSIRIRLFIVSVLCASVCALHAEQPTSRASDVIDIFNDVLRQLDVNYVDTLNYESLTEAAIREMLRQVDPYTIYYSEKETKRLEEMTTGQYGGIGAVIQQREVTVDDKKVIRCYIANPYEGLPAQRSGLQAGDRIISINGEAQEGKPVSEVSRALRGVPGSDITVVVERLGVAEPITMSFKREEIRRDPVAYYAAYSADSLVAPVGYIRFEDFTENSARDVANALDELVGQRHIRSLVLDLRGNGGGLVGEAIQMVNLFIERNTEVVYTEGKNGANHYSYRTRSMPRYPDLPLVIMVDDNTASAAEIVCGSLQDLHRATLVGQRTFGKGLVQSIRPITNNGKLKVTTSRYYLPSGRCIQAIDYAKRQKGEKLEKDTTGGILPDIVMEDSSKVDITYALYTENKFFDYATYYHLHHDTLADPLSFELTDQDIADFCDWLEQDKFEFRTETGKYYERLLELAHHEDLDSAAYVELEKIKPILTPNWRDAIARHREDVRRLLGAEIVLRYYYQRGELAYQLRFDPEFQRAIQECNNKLLVISQPVVSSGGSRTGS